MVAKKSYVLTTERNGPILYNSAWIEAWNALPEEEPPPDWDYDNELELAKAIDPTQAVRSFAKTIFLRRNYLWKMFGK